MPTDGRQIRAVRTGTVSEMQMTAPVIGASNILVQHTPNEFSGYLHMGLGSALVSVGSSVQAGTPLGSASDVGAPGNFHLHFAVSNNSESKHQQLVTFPVAFSNYYASDDYGNTWHFVSFGMPRVGQWVRH
jgi:murein DD-endopeptidase MepM/ murein hydrolase activator NlpD